MLPFLLPWLLSLTPLAEAQIARLPPQASSPHAYPGIPNTDYIYNSSNQKQWQDYYRVDSSTLPNATQCEMPSGYAGNVPVNRSGFSNDTLFMWAFEKTPGSLANESSTEIYVDNPVGTGYSTASDGGYIVDEDQMGEDFMGFLANMANIFPGLANRPLYLLGESYAGTYIPYITKAYFGMETPPVSLKEIVMADATMMSLDATEQTPTVLALETYPQIIGYDIEVYKYFREQLHLCGYDLNYTFPQTKPLPSVRSAFLDESSPFAATARAAQKARFTLKQTARVRQTINRALKRDVLEEEERKREFQAKVRELRASPTSVSSISRRDLSGRATNGTIDPFYHCDLLDEIIDYALNFTEPWSDAFGEFDIYDVPDTLFPEPPMGDDPTSPTTFLNDKRTAVGLHAPQDEAWEDTINYPFNNTFEVPDNANIFGDTSKFPYVTHYIENLPAYNSGPPSIFILSDLATNASKKGVGMTFIAGQADFLVSPASTLGSIQNFTFGGIRGYTKVPSTKWYSDNGEFGGIVHQERNVTFGLFKGAGHLTSLWQAEHYHSFIKNFVVNKNINGTLDSSGKPIGDQQPLSHAFNIPAEHDAIFTGSGTTMGSTVWPSATIAAWDSAIAPFITSTPTTNKTISNMTNGFTSLTSTIPFKTLISLMLAGGLMVIR
ncbi:hypothetical protein Clacol_004489 [Clathrus columnatus]|uniref:Carboxypeptidase n=1 Tax=Clathrus columnatus TaxID=1419009 RepID=A0AAV5A9W4_9AGAM|nr:hypothetical protein Clacol_004489 [Clathrus columnatus]